MFHAKLNRTAPLLLAVTLVLTQYGGCTVGDGAFGYLSGSLDGLLTSLFAGPYEQPYYEQQYYEYDEEYYYEEYYYEEEIIYYQPDPFWLGSPW